MRVHVATPQDIPAWLALAAEVEAQFGPLVDNPGFVRALEKNIARETAFCVRDELYIQAYSNDVAVTLVAVDRGVAYPMAWTRQEGRGRVAHIALGHTPEVWASDPFQRLFLRSLAWLAQSKRGAPDVIYL